MVSAVLSCEVDGEGPATVVAAAASASATPSTGWDRSIGTLAPRPPSCCRSALPIIPRGQCQPLPSLSASTHLQELQYVHQQLRIKDINGDPIFQFRERGSSVLYISQKTLVIFFSPARGITLTKERQNEKHLSPSFGFTVDSDRDHYDLYSKTSGTKQNPQPALV